MGVELRLGSLISSPPSWAEIGPEGPRAHLGTWHIPCGFRWCRPRLSPLEPDQFASNCWVLGSREVFRNLVLFGDGGMIFKKIGASFGGELSFDF